MSDGGGRVVETDSGSASVGYHLTETSAGHGCGECAAEATAYVHKAGFRCGNCHEHAPDRRAPSGDGGSMYPTAHAGRRRREPAVRRRGDSRE